MVIKTKTTQQIREWFGSQWTLIRNDYQNEYNNGELDRLEEMFAGLSGQKQIKFHHPLQAPYTFYLPNLPTKTFFNTESFQLAKELEENYEIIKNELEQLINEEETNSKFNEYIGDGINSDKSRMTNSSGEWKVFYFWQQFLENTENCLKCPKTYELLKRLQKEELLLSGMVCFSSLKPGTNIVPHTGPSNMRLTCHLGLIGCENTKIFVGADSSPFKEGKCIIFDDSFVHEVKHNGDKRRVTLMLDLWHPNMKKIEIEIFKKVMENSTTFMHPDEFFHSLKLVKTNIKKL